MCHNLYIIYSNRGHFKRRQKQFEEFIENGEIILIGIYDDMPCGLVFANKDNDEQLAECGSIYSIYFLKEYWGKGLGTKLMDEAINILKSTAIFPINLLN